jgi:hypothetical protein
MAALIRKEFLRLAAVGLGAVAAIPQIGETCMLACLRS